MAAAIQIGVAHRGGGGQSRLGAQLIDGAGIAIPVFVVLLGELFVLGCGGQEPCVALSCVHVHVPEGAGDARVGAEAEGLRARLFERFHERGASGQRRGSELRAQRTRSDLDEHRS